MKFITDTLQEIQAAGEASCRLCPEGDDGVPVEDAESWGDVLDALYHHGVDDHGLPPDGGPWTDEMLGEHSEADQ